MSDKSEGEVKSNQPDVQPDALRAEIVRIAQTLLRTLKSRTPVSEWQRDMMKAVSPEEMRAIVKAGGVPQRSGLADAPAVPPKYAGDGVRPLAPPPGVKLCDAMMDVADKVDAAELAERLAKAGMRG